MSDIDRRSFLRGAAIGAAGLTAVGGLAGCNTASVAGGADPTQSTGLTEGVGADSRWNFEIAPKAIADSEISSSEDADVIVIGAGMSGLCAATSCKENGLSVILISASQAAVSRGGSNNAVYSKVMKKMGLPKLDPTEFYRNEYFANGGNFKPAFWYKFYKNSEEAMDWLIDKATAAGIKTTIESAASYGPTDIMYMPPAAHAFYTDDSELQGTIGTGEPHIAKEMARAFTDDLGGTIHWQMTACQLIRGGQTNGTSGKITGVIAQNADGKYVKYTAGKAVIMATGDFSHDKDMMTRYCPECVDLCDFTTPINYDAGLNVGGLMPGTGQKMGLWIGAAWQVTQPNVFMLGRPNFPCDNPYTSHTGLMVDGNGERFMNEDVLGGVACATVVHLVDHTCYCIWGTNRAKDGAPWGKPNYAYGSTFKTEEFIETWDKDTFGYGIKKNDTITGLVTDLGLPAETVKTIGRYNDLCKAGADEDFHKRQEKMIGITQPPFYGCAFKPMFLTSLGGLRTNVDLQVCDATDTPIEGLFNVGSMIGDMYSGTYTFAMEGVNYGATCVTLPYVLGKDIASGKFD